MESFDLIIQKVALQQLLQGSKSFRKSISATIKCDILPKGLDSMN